jgi:hypothetical protein
MLLGRPGDSIRHLAANTSQMAHVRYKLDHLGKVPALPGCPAESPNQCFVIGDDGEAPALNNEAEVANPLHAGQKLSIKSIPLDLRG